MHVLRQVHTALRNDGLLLDAHPLGLDFAVRAGERGLGFVDTRDFRQVLRAMDEQLAIVVAEGLFEEIATARRHVAERFDNGREALAEAQTWQHLRLPFIVRRRLARTASKPVEFIDTIRYRLFARR